MYPDNNILTYLKWRGDVDFSTSPFNDIDAMESEIRRVCTEKPFSEHMCLERAKNFDEAYLSEQYCKLYIDIIKHNLDRNL